MNDRDWPFLRPLWRRIVLVAFCALWAVLEWWNGAIGWAALAAAAAAYGAWTFLIDYERKPPDGG